MFKSATNFSIIENIPQNSENCQLAAEAESAPIELSSTEKIMWSSPYGPGHNSLVLSGNGQILMAIEKSQKLIPTAIINQSVNEQISIIRYQEGREPPKREKAAIKEKIIYEMTGKAFVKKQIIHIYLDPANQRLTISSSQKALVDACLELIYQTFPKIELEAPEILASSAMTDWLRQRSLPAPFTLLHDCELKNTEDNSSIKFKGLDLLSEDVLSHLNHSTQVQKLTLVYDEKMQFTLNSDGCISAIKLLEFTKDKANIATDSRQAELEADFILSADILSSCLNSLSQIFEPA